MGSFFSSSADFPRSRTIGGGHHTHTSGSRANLSKFNRKLFLIQVCNLLLKNACEDVLIHLIINVVLCNIFFFGIGKACHS